ncbi:peroxiredoxin [Nocardioides caldifontis]|uniref:peroxiredoxin n=1 Tax=Nocardioides caldifontis TaxID=2588938 RepID=UPI0011DF2C40|nr:peroxiredoxin [Nocardioides caldifontis]
MTGLPDGTAAPDFALRDQHGQQVALSDLRGSRKVLLVFYPSAFSSVCTGELSELQQAWTTFASHEVEILGISCDPMFSLRAFADSHDIHFPLLSDFWPHGAVASAYGVFNEATGAALRSTFVIDRAGTVAWSVHNAMPDARSLKEYAEVLDRIS